MKRLVTAALAVAALGLSHLAAAQDTSAAIAAFQKSPEVQQLVKGAQLNGMEPGRVDTVIVDSSCEKAGCAYSALVVQQMVTQEEHPQSMSVMALVTVTAKGAIKSVELVSLAGH